MKILITGGFGFIGSHLLKKLITGTDFQIGVIEPGTADPWRVKDILPKIKTFSLDIKDYNRVSETIKTFNPDIIIHLSAYYAVEHKSAEINAMFNTNVTGLTNLLDSCAENPVKLFINTSTCFVYRESKTPVTETGDILPVNLYALTKVHGEKTCDYYSEKYNIPTVTLRLFPPYGQRDAARKLIPVLVHDFMNNTPPKLGDGKNQWDYVYVEDIAESYLRIINKLKFPSMHEIINIGTGKTASVKDIVLKIKNILNSSAEPLWNAYSRNKSELAYVCSDNTKIKSVLNWAPGTGMLDDGLIKTVEWYRQYFMKNG